MKSPQTYLVTSLGTKKNCFHAIMLFHPQLHGSNVKGNQYRTTTILHIIWHYMCTANMYFLCKDYKFPLCPNFQCTGNPLIVWLWNPEKTLQMEIPTIIGFFMV